MKIIPYIFLLLIFCLPTHLFSVAQEQPKEFDENYARALAKYRIEEFDKCIDILTVAIRDDNTNAYYYLLRGDAFYALKKYRTAVSDYREAQKIESDFAYLQTARVYAQLDQTGEAIENLRAYFKMRDKQPLSAIKLDPAFSNLVESREWGELMTEKHYNTVETEMSEIQYLLNADRITEAFSLVNSRIKKSKRYAQAYALRGDIYLQNKEYKRALKDYSSAVKFDKRNADYFLKRARVYMTAGEYRNAAADYAQYAELIPNEIVVYKEKARAEYFSENYAQALTDLDYYTQFFSQSAATYYLKGQIHLAENNNLSALKSLNKCLEADASDYRYFKARSEAFKRAGMYERALNDLGMALDLHPDGETYYLRALIRLELGDINGACYDKKIALQYRYYKAADILVNCPE